VAAISWRDHLTRCNSENSTLEWNSGGESFPPGDSFKKKKLILAAEIDLIPPTVEKIHPALIIPAEFDYICCVLFSQNTTESLFAVFSENTRERKVTRLTCKIHMVNQSFKQRTIF
jgi:hypothetical protein